MTKRHVQKTAFQLMFIFFIIYMTFNGIATVYYFIQGYEVYGPPGNNDSAYYHAQATLIAQSGDFSYATLPYEYLVGAVYYLFGVAAGPFIFKIFMCVIASINVFLIVSIIGHFCIHHEGTEKTFNKWTKVISLLLLIYPTYNFYILNMYRDIILVNGALVFIYSFINIFIYKIRKKTNHFLFVISILYVFILRPYFGALMIATILVYIFSDRKHRTLRNVVMLLLFVILAGIMLKFTKYGFFGINYISSLANIESIANYRMLSSAGNLVLNINIDFSNPIQFIITYSYAFIVNHIFPFPTYYNTLSSLVLLPESMVILYLLLNSLRHMKGKTKVYKELKFLLIYYFLNVGFIVSFSDNMGTNIRLRMSFVVCLFIMFFISKQYKSTAIDNRPDPNKTLLQR